MCCDDYLNAWQSDFNYLTRENWIHALKNIIKINVSCYVVKWGMEFEFLMGLKRRIKKVSSGWEFRGF